MSMSKSFTDILNQITTQSKLPTTLLYNLSKINRENLVTFQQVWPTISVERRQSVMQELLELTEDNFEVNFDPIFLLALGDTDPKVRATAIKSLWEYERPTLIAPLIHLLKTDEAVMVREAAASALGKFIYLKEIEEIDPNEAALAEEALLEVIYHPSEDVEVQRRAIEAISYSSRPNIPQILENAYYSDYDKMKVSSIFGMGRNADARWISWVMTELDSPEVELRFEAARACGELEATTAVDKLIELIAEEIDFEVQEMAIWALGRIGGQKARLALESYLEGEDEKLALAAEESLDELNLFDDTFLLYNFEDETGNDLLQFNDNQEEEDEF